MATMNGGTVRNGKIHPGRIRVPSAQGDKSLRASSTVVESSPSFRSNLAKRVRDLAHRQRTSESAIVDCALWFFFDKGQDANVMSLMSRAGIAPRRRRA
jgi:hypothetical protein